MADCACGTCGWDVNRCICLPSDFAKLPTSISEAKANRSEYARDCTPRDALIQLLRKIDAGEINPQLIVIGWGRECEDGTTEMAFKFAGPGNSMEFLGLATRMVHHAQ